MIFNSYEYLIFFPIVCLLYFVIPKKCQYIWLLFTSYFFYMCWNAKYALLLLFVTTVTYACGIFISKAKKESGKKLCVCVGFVLCLAVLFLFKYADFFGATANSVLGRIGVSYSIRRFDFVLPVGISFYTFQALSYLVDVYRDEVKVEKNFFMFALFVSFFPQLVAGPIERSKNLLSQVNEEHKFSFENMRDGLLLMIWGFFMKLVIADRAAIFVDKVYGDINAYTGEFLLMAAILFSIQIYCDFAGYSIIAIGSAKVMGFTLMENFNGPYLSETVEKFWRNWHISLTSWFRDYLYIPLGGNRKGKIRKYVNIMIVFLVSGLWHGAGWHFVVWGGLNGAYQVIGDSLSGIRRKLSEKILVSRGGLILYAVRICMTCLLVGVSWIFFRAASLSEASYVIRNILSIRGINIENWKNVFKAILTNKQFFVLIIAIFILFIADVLKKRNVCISEWIKTRNIVVRWGIYTLAVMSIVIFGVWGPQFLASNFIYFQF